MNRLFKKYGINFIYFWSTFIFVVLLFSVLIWFSYHYSVKNIIDVTTTNQSRILSVLDEKLQAKFNSIESTSLSLIMNYDLWDSVQASGDRYKDIQSYKNVQASLNTLVFSTPLIFSIDFYVKDGPTSSGRDLVRFMPLDEMKNLPWYSPIEKSDFSWIGEHRTESHMGESSVISFARKMYSISREYQGVVAINVAATEIQKLLRDPDRNRKRLLIDSGGRLITQVGRQETEGDQGESFTFIEDILKDPNHSPYKGSKRMNNESLLVWVKQKNTGLLLIEITPWNELVAGSHKMAITMLLIAVSAIFILFFFFYFVNRSFTRPIFILLRVMRLFPKEIDHPLPKDYHNEFGQLFKGYEILLMKINELHESLKTNYQKQRESEIKVLQAQINPHFLYNTLNQLNWMAIKEGNDKMSSVLELTGKMLRIGLSNGQALIPLFEELEHVECYMRIQQIRLGKDFDYTFELPDVMRTFLVPKVILQPIVENSIRHGFHGLKGGHIHICCQHVENHVVITVEDNGVGLPNQSAHFKPTTDGGYGVYNIKERLHAFFGSGNHFQIQNRIEGGVLVTLRLPFIEE